jgi:hypothetical protein
MTDWETESHIKQDLENISKILNIPYKLLRQSYDNIIVIKDKVIEKRT